MKMRGKRRKWGRCKLHGQHCEVACDIRENTSTRASEKTETSKEVNITLDSIISKEYSNLSTQLLGE